MKQCYLFLWLEAPLQSWGTDSIFFRRNTLDFPTKSGILGMILCALGLSGKQIDFLARFTNLKQTVLSFSNNSEKTGQLSDYQTIGAGADPEDPWMSYFVPRTSSLGFQKDATGAKIGTRITQRQYLQSAFFAVLLEVPEDLSTSIKDALNNPVFPIYLGRRCCIPSEFVYQGTYPSEELAEKAARKFAIQKNEYSKKLFSSSTCLEPQFKVIDGDFPDQGDVFTLRDVPIQFGEEKKYADRRVTKINLNS